MYFGHNAMACGDLCGVGGNCCVHVDVRVLCVVVRVLRLCTCYLNQFWRAVGVSSRCLFVLIGAAGLFVANVSVAILDRWNLRQANQARSMRAAHSSN